VRRLIEEALVDAYGQDEQHGAFLVMLDDHVACPFTALVVGEEVEVRGFGDGGEPGRLAVPSAGRGARGRESWRRGPPHRSPARGAPARARSSRSSLAVSAGWTTKATLQRLTVDQPLPGASRPAEGICRLVAERGRYGEEHFVPLTQTHDSLRFERCEHPVREASPDRPARRPECESPHRVRRAPSWTLWARIRVATRRLADLGWGGKGIRMSRHRPPSAQGAAANHPPHQEKVSAQRRIRELEAERNRKRRSLFEAQDEIDRQKEGLISDVEARLRQQVETEPLFTIRWRVE
jgi:hypothetical protein